MHVVEGEPHRIIADRLHLENLHISLARNGFSLVRRVTLHFGAWALHAQVFGGQQKLLAAIEADRKPLAILGKPDFGRPGHGRASTDRVWDRRVAFRGTEWHTQRGSRKAKTGRSPPADR